MFNVLRCCHSRIVFSVQTKIFSRKYMTVSEKMEILLKQKDHIPRDYKLIYRDAHPQYVSLSYHTLNFMSYMTLATVGYLWYNDIPIQKNADHFTLSKNYVESASIIIGTISIFVVAIWLRRRFVLRVYFSKEAKNCKMIFIGRMPFTCECHDFPAKSLTFASPRDSVFPWKDVAYRFSNRKVYLFEDNFRTYADFLQMLKHGEQ